MRFQAETFHNVLPKDGEVYYFPGCFSAGESDHYFLRLQEEVSWKQEPIILFGKKMMQPRLTAWLGDAGLAYSYSGITMQPQPWTASMLEIRERVNAVASVEFNSALLNLYRDGTDSMGWHRDNEKGLGAEPVIGSVSFGATRNFMFRHMDDRTLKQTVALTSGSLLLMRGKTQQCWQHAVPKTSRAIGMRINITFRVIIS